MRWRTCCTVSALSVAIALAAPASADEVDLEALPMATDSDYAIDLYLGPALGSARILTVGFDPG